MKFGYEELDVTKRIHELVAAVYLVTEGFPKEERFGLTSQIRRAATSVLLNLAEGSSRKSRGDYERGITIAIGSLVEVDAAMKIAQNLRYIEPSLWANHDKTLEKVYFSLVRLRSSIHQLRS